MEFYFSLVMTALASTIGCRKSLRTQLGAPPRLPALPSLACASLFQIHGVKSFLYHQAWCPRFRCIGSRKGEEWKTYVNQVYLFLLKKRWLSHNHIQQAFTNIFLVWTSSCDHYWPKGCLERCLFCYAAEPDKVKVPFREKGKMFFG